MLNRIRKALSPSYAREEAFMNLVRAGRAQIGRHSYAAPNVRTFAGDSTRLVIGNFTSIAGGVTFVLGGNHPIDRISTFPLRERLGLEGVHADGFPSSKGDILVGNDVWIGTNATVLSGVKIGDGAVIGAGSLVTRDVPPFTLAVGTPARVLRERFSEEIRTELASLEWWNWPDELVAQAAHLLNDPIAHNDAIDQLRDLKLRKG